MKKIMLILLIAIYIFIALYFKPWKPLIEGAKPFETTLAIVAIITLLGVVGCCIGMMLGYNLCRKWFFLFNVIFLLFGCYAAYMYWTFWIFEEPTFAEKVKDTAIPFLLGVAMPIWLFYYFTRASFKNSFKK